MIEGIIASVITLIGVIITNITTSLMSNKKVESQLATQQAITDTKLDNLTREVNKHNNFAGRIPVIEEKIDNLERRVTILEDK